MTAGGTFAKVARLTTAPDGESRMASTLMNSPSTTAKAVSTSSGTGQGGAQQGAWTTILFRYQDWDPRKEEYSKDRFSIRRYQKRNGEYQQKSKFNISSP